MTRGSPGVGVGLSVLAAAWLVAVAAGFGLLLRYGSTPGAAAAPERWPAASALPRPSGRPALLLFLHPKCPCSRATLSEMERVLARCGGAFEGHVLLERPTGTPEGWAETDLARRAAALPGMESREDPGGAEARLFGAGTSGTVAVYGAGGRRLFFGGITAGRGHEGGNEGAEALVALARGTTPAVGSTPAFGCPMEARRP